MSYQKVFAKLKQSTKYSPKSLQPHVFYPNQFVALHVPSVLNKTRIVQFFIPMEMTKPELKQYLENYYNINGIVDIHTTITRGRDDRRSRRTGRLRKKEADEKKAYVTLAEPIELDISEDMKKEILRFYDRSTNKEYQKERKEKEAQEMARRMQQQQAADAAAAASASATAGAPGSSSAAG